MFGDKKYARNEELDPLDRSSDSVSLLHSRLNTNKDAVLGAELTGEMTEKIHCILMKNGRNRWKPFLRENNDHMQRWQKKSA